MNRNRLSPFAAVVLALAASVAAAAAQELPDTAYGFALTDTTLVENGAGRGFRYRDDTGHYADVFLYRVGDDRLASADSVRLEAEVETFLAALPVGQRRGWYDVYQVPVRTTVEVPSPGGSESGRVVVIVFRRGAATSVSFMPLFLLEDSYLKVRLTLDAEEWATSTLPNFATELAARVYAAGGSS